MQVSLFGSGKFFMAIRLKTLFFILVLSVSVLSGAPLQSGDMGMRKNACPMKCCKKSAKSKKPESADTKMLCRVLICSRDLPTNTGSAPQINLAPVIIASERISLFEILFSTTPKESALPVSVQTPLLTTSQPKYIQHQRILI